MYLDYEYIRGEYRWHFKYNDFWKVCRKHRIHLCSCSEFRWSAKTWPESDLQKAEKFVRAYWEKFFRLKDADCLNCGVPFWYPSELCTTCSTIAHIKAGRLRFTENRRGDTILVPVPHEQTKAVV